MNFSAILVSSLIPKQLGCRATARKRGCDFILCNTPIPDKIGSCMEVRLNNPRGKFKITNMADDQVDFTPEDIPGASFREEEIKKWAVAQLKFWIKCLRINQNGNKKEPLER